MLLAAKHVEMVFFVRRIWLSLFHLLFMSDLTVVFFWNTWLVDGIFSIFYVAQILLLSVACGIVFNARNKIQKISLALMRPYSQS